jgi:hypothetical protein
MRPAWVSDLLTFADQFPRWTELTVAHDGFEGQVIGYYVTREHKPGLVLQQNGNRVVHVYSTKWFEPKETDNAG